MRLEGPIPIFSCSEGNSSEIRCNKERKLHGVRAKRMQREEFGKEKRNSTFSRGEVSMFKCFNRL